jgi:two-component system, OmpR family, sensor histidine kinase VicK
LVFTWLLRFVSKATTEINACLDAKGPSVMLEVKPIKKARLDAKRRGVKFRYITEITKDNVDYCKGLLEFVDELRHLSGIKGNFELCYKKEYIATATLQKAQPIDELIYSNVRQIVEQEQFVFDTFWSKAVPSKERIREIEEGVEPEFFDVITDRERVCRIFVDLPLCDRYLSISNLLVNSQNCVISDEWLAKPTTLLMTY